MSTAVGVRGLADEVLQALASSDLEALRRLCSPQLLMFGTDAGERWCDLAALCAALEPMRELGLEAHWKPEPEIGPNWAAGTAVYRSRGGPPVLARVTLVFEHDVLVHGHFSIEGQMPV
jgi:hypothetical protein